MAQGPGNPNHDERGRFASAASGAVKGAAIGVVGGAALGALRGVGMAALGANPAVALGAGTAAAIAGAVSWGSTGAAVGAITGLVRHKGNVKAHIAKQHKPIAEDKPLPRSELNKLSPAKRREAVALDRRHQTYLKKNPSQRG